MKNKTIYWINNRIVEEAHIPVSDRGLLYGQGVFTTIRVYNNYPFMLDRHIKRLKQGCSFLKIKIPSIRKIKYGIKKLIQYYNISSMRIRITITAGNKYPSPYSKGPFEGRTVLSCSGLGPTGLVSLFTSSFKRNPSDPLSGIKSLNYLPSILSKIEAIENKKDEGLLLDTEGYVSETSFANIFWIKNKTLFTPSEECGILSGITRLIVINIGKNMGLKIKTGRFKKKALLNSSSAFITNSVREITQVLSLDNQTIGCKAETKYIRGIKDGYKKLVTSASEPV